MAEAGQRRPRWDPDDRGIGVGDARDLVPWIDALRMAANRAGWVAEEPEVHLLPALVARIAGGAPWSIEATATEPDGAFVVDLRWTGPAGSDRRTLRTEAYGLIGAIAEGTTAVVETAGLRGPSFSVVTGLLTDQTEFAPHGHTLRLEIDGTSESEST